MTWPFLYFAGERLSDAELMAARLDGDLVDIGHAYMPADAVETRELRAGSLTPLIDPRLAMTHESAAWIHGIVGEPPARHSVQRCATTRPHHALVRRLRYRDQFLPQRDVEQIAGLFVTTPERTLADLLRDRMARDVGDTALIEEVIRWRPALVQHTLEWFEIAGPVPFKRPSIAYLRARPHDDVTR